MMLIYLQKSTENLSPKETKGMIGLSHLPCSCYSFHKQICGAHPPKVLNLFITTLTLTPTNDVSNKHNEDESSQSTSHCYWYNVVVRFRFWSWFILRTFLQICKRENWKKHKHLNYSMAIGCTCRAKGSKWPLPPHTRKGVGKMWLFSLMLVHKASWSNISRIESICFCLLGLWYIYIYDQKVILTWLASLNMISVYCVSIALFTFRYFNNTLPVTFDNFFKLNMELHSHNTRSSKKNSYRSYKYKL